MPSCSACGASLADAARFCQGSSFVTGDAVNVAARLEQAAAPGEILVGERTVAAARGAFEFGEPQTVEAKGKEGGAACRRLLRALSLMRPRGVAGLHRAFVGRESELELLQATYRRAVELREPHLVTIMGDAGVGKTRLVRELWEWLASQEPQPLQRTGRCLPYGRLTYWALGEVLKEHLGILESDSPETVSRRLGGREILGLALGLDVAGDLHPLAARDRLHEAWVDFLGENAHLVLALEAGCPSRRARRPRGARSPRAGGARADEEPDLPRAVRAPCPRPRPGGRAAARASPPPVREAWAPLARGADARPTCGLDFAREVR